MAPATEPREPTQPTAATTSVSHVPAAGTKLVSWHIQIEGCGAWEEGEQEHGVASLTHMGPCTTALHSSSQVTRLAPALSTLTYQYGHPLAPTWWLRACFMAHPDAKLPPCSSNCFSTKYNAMPLQAPSAPSWWSGAVHDTEFSPCTSARFPHRNCVLPLQAPSAPTWWLGGGS